VDVFSTVVSLLVINRPRLRTLPPPHSYGNQRLQRQFDGLLMLGIIMPETCWAVSVRQSNNILRLIVASSWVFYLSDKPALQRRVLQTAYECGGGSVLSRCRLISDNKPTTAENTSTSTFIRNPEAATAVWRAPDDVHNNARNMLSSVCTTKQ